MIDDLITFKTYDKDLRRWREVTRKGHVFTIGAQDVVLFPIGVLSEALQLHAQTLRKWQRQERFPAPLFVVSDRSRRLYSREQILALHKLRMEMCSTPFQLSRSRWFALDEFLKRAGKLFYSVHGQGGD